MECRKSSLRSGRKGGKGKLCMYNIVMKGVKRGWGVGGSRVIERDNSQ